MLLLRTQKRKFQPGKCIGNEEFAWSSLFEKQNLQAKTLLTQSVKTYCLQSPKSDDYLPNSLTARGNGWHTSQTTKTVNSFWEYVLSFFLKQTHSKQTHSKQTHSDVLRHLQKYILLWKNQQQKESKLKTNISCRKKHWFTPFHSIKDKAKYTFWNVKRFLFPIYRVKRG